MYKFTNNTQHATRNTQHATRNTQFLYYMGIENPITHSTQKPADQAESLRRLMEEGDNKANKKKPGEKNGLKEPEREAEQARHLREFIKKKDNPK
ncbi:MAG: hypothetical protein WC323_00375 [Patescibacteria group bacterium]|jgi:hypothetical protein